MENPHYSRIQLLLGQQNYDEAEKKCREALQHSPQDVYLIALLAEVKIQKDEEKEALKLIQMALGLSPDYDYLFFLKARAHLGLEEYDQAEDSLKKAVEMDPTDADYFALWANIKLIRKRYQEALDLANKSLEFDPENLVGLNTRSTALLKLDKKDESFSTIENALREDPNNPYTHANYGWGLLEKGKHKKAMSHFMEALKNDPNHPYAQAGMIEAIKAQNPVYRLFLKYAFAMNNLTAKYQWGVILGFYFGFKGLQTVARNNPALEPYLSPLLLLLTILAFSTWVINPLSNLFLRFNRYGKVLLDNSERYNSNAVAASLLVFVIGVAGYIGISGDAWLAVAAYGFGMMIPSGFAFSPSKPPRGYLYYTLAMAIVGLNAVYLTFTTGNLFNTWSSIFLLGIFAFQWIANFMTIQQGNK